MIVTPSHFIREGMEMKISAISLMLLFSVLASAASGQNQNTSLIWITDVVIISPENLNHIDKGSVLIKDERIVRVERSPGAKKPAGAVVFSGKGEYLIPGLIDSHVHLASVPGMAIDPSDGEQKIAQQYFQYFQQLPRSYLYFGYTTLVDLAVLSPRLMADFRHAPQHPDLYDCGGSLPIANGYPMSFVPPAVRFKLFPNFIYDPQQADHIPPEYKPEDHTPAADVARVKSSGGVCVKTYFEHGFGRDRNLPVITPELFAQVRKAATGNGLVLMTHANSFEAQKFAVDGNVDVIAHGMWHWGALDKRPELPDEIKALLDQIVAKHIGYQPTIQVLYGEMAYFDPEYLKMKALAKIAPKEMVDWFQTPSGKWFGKEVNEDGASDAAFLDEYEQGPLRRVRQVVTYLASRDANFLFGTDTPSAPTYGNLPGLNGYMEMRQLLKAGMSLTQIFNAATINNAREFKLESQLGSIEPGKIANLVLMKQSPLKTVDAYDSITTIWVHGNTISRDSLAADSNFPLQ
jgi:imidazolonepropionase-like amidohydrolase